jgi:hypothetical protein
VRVVEGGSVVHYTGCNNGGRKHREAACFGYQGSCVAITMPSVGGLQPGLHRVTSVAITMSSVGELKPGLHRVTSVAYSESFRGIPCCYATRITNIVTIEC